MAGRVIDVTMQLNDKVTGPLQGLTGSLANSNKQWQRAGREITNTGRDIYKVGQGLTTAITLPVVGLATGAVKTAAGFEAGMSKVQAISGATEEDMKSLTEKAMEMGAKTKFSATEASDAFSYMAMAGWKTEQMMSGIEGVMYLAGATEEDLAMTSDIVTDAMTAFGMAADGTSTVIKDGVAKEVPNVTRFVDVMAAAANNANTNVGMLGESFKYVAGTAGGMGYDIEDVATALGLMANSGIKASQGGTALNNIITRMAKPTKESATAMDALGLSLQNDDGSMKSFMQIMEDMRAGFPKLKISISDFTERMNALDEAFEAGKITEKQYGKEQEALMHIAYGAEGALTAEYAAMLAGKTGMSGLMAIVNASDKDFNKLATAISNSNGACEEMYKITQNNLIGRLTILKSTVESIAIAFGNELIPWVEKSTSFLQGLADKFNSLDSAQRQQIAKFAAIAAAAGPALMVFGKTVTTIGSIVTGIGRVGAAIKAAGSVMAALTGPGAIAIAIVLAIAAAAFRIIQNWDQVKAAALQLWASIQPILTYIQTKWTELATHIQTTWQSSIQPAWQQFSAKVGELWTAAQPVLTKLGEIYKEVFEIKLKFAIDMAVTYFQWFFDIISSTVTLIINLYTGLIDFVMGVFTGNWQQAWDGVAQIFSSCWEFMESVAEAACSFMSGLVSGVASAFSGLLSLIESVRSAASTIGGGSHGFNAVGTSFWRGGTTWVHERGAELIDLPRGTRIYPHSESLKMAYQEGQANGGGRGGNVNITVAKLADSIQVRNDSDIEAIAAALANKLELTAHNIGGGEIGYVY